MNPSKEQRIQSYLDRCQGAVSGQRGHDHTFRVACAIIKGFNVSSTGEALGYLQSWNSKCDPLWDDDELLHKIQSAQGAPNLLGLPGYLLEKEPNGNFSGTQKEYVPQPRPVATLDPEVALSRKVAMMGKEKLETLPGWSVAQMKLDSPIKLPTTADGMFEEHLKLWNPADITWCGDVRDTGNPAKSSHFAKAITWYQRGLPTGCFTSGCTYKPGTYSRCKEDMIDHRYAIVESDRLSYERQGAIFAYLIKLGLPICMIVDTMGASLHGWLDVRGLTDEYVKRLQYLLCGLHDGLEDNPDHPGTKRRKFLGGMGCDPATFRGSQPCRLPGAYRTPQPEKGKRGGIQEIIYLA